MHDSNSTDNWDTGLLTDINSERELLEQKRTCRAL